MIKLFPDLHDVGLLDEAASLYNQIVSLLAPITLIEDVLIRDMRGDPIVLFGDMAAIHIRPQPLVLT